jgi:hypothetical protein
MLDEVVVAAVASWESDGWRSFDDHEANRTVQLYKWIEEAIRVTPDLRSLSPRLEWVQPTPQMYAGTESATKIPRPDIRIFVGTSAGVTVECKRLSLSNQHPVRYVGEGMNRFVSGSYSSSEERGRMVGYVEADRPHQIVAAVNASVCSHPAMGPDHVLDVALPAGSSLHRYRSSHKRAPLPDISLIHHWIDVT